MQTLYQSPERLVEIYKLFNFDFSSQAGLMMTVPFKVKNGWTPVLQPSAFAIAKKTVIFGISRLTVNYIHLC